MNTSSSGLTQYDCPECKNRYFLIFDGKAAHCPACLSLLIPKDYPKMPNKEPAEPEPSPE
jgi:hypothetical protein